MTAWTWMKFSYAWDASPYDLWKALPRCTVGYIDMDSVEVFRTRSDIDGPYVRLRGTVTETGTMPWLEGEYAELNAAMVDAVTGTSSVIVLDDLHGRDFAVVAVVSGEDEQLKPGHRAELVGRVRYSPHHSRYVPGQSWMPRVFCLPLTRFTGESIAGLVVGAMGVFIFGLYLRRWVRERKTAA
jgi:hypothetical protein